MPHVKFGYYLYCYTDLANPENAKSGVEKKIISQIKTLNAYGVKCKFVYCKAPNNLLKKIISCIPFFSDGISWPPIEQLNNPSFIYIRRPAVVGKELIDFLAAFKNKYPDAMVLYEIPSYPYDKEMTGLLSLALVKDRIYRKKLSDNVDYIVDLSGENRIFGIPTIQITNGIDLSMYAEKKPVNLNNEINILSVAFFERWHGIDRFIVGMRDYVQSHGQLIHLHLVGAGTALSELKKKVADYGLSDFVTFYGVLEGESLSEIYNKCSLAIECLGIHRRGKGQKSSSLKSREYMARGMPFIGSSPIDVFENEYVDFFLKMPESEEPINIEAVVQFHNELYAKYSQSELIAKIREFANLHISMDMAMKSVIDILSDR